jgi:hypothetical protein
MRVMPVFGNLPGARPLPAVSRIYATWPAGKATGKNASVSADPGEQLRRLADEVAERVSPELARWFIEAVGKVERGEVDSLDGALCEIEKQGQRPLAWHIREQAKDQNLQAAWLQVADDDADDVRRADLLAAEIQKFQDEKWPAWRHRDEPPADATELQTALFRAHQTGQQIPTTRRRLLEKFRRPRAVTYHMLLHWPGAL